jgi:DNA replication protein DnaC
MTNTTLDFEEREFEEANQRLLKIKAENKSLHPEPILTDHEKLMQVIKIQAEKSKLLKIEQLKKTAKTCIFCQHYPTDEELLSTEHWKAEYVCGCDGAVKDRQRITDKIEAQAKEAEKAKLISIINNSLPKRFKDCTFDNYIGNPKLTATLKQSAKNKESIILSGSVGSGKTHLAIAYLREFLISQQSGHFLITYIAEMIDKIFKDDNNLENVQQCNLLMLDDLGAESVKEWGLEKIFDVINYRYMELLPLIITTNLNAKELSAKIGQRSFSRIIEMCQPFEVKGEDYRIKNLKKA